MPNTGENPGRGHLYDFGGLKVLVDFAHNPHGMRALIETARAMPAKRRLVILGQAGDRDDESIRGLARETWLWRPDRIILKEMAIYLRGRQPGEATGLLEDEFKKVRAMSSASEKLARLVALGTWENPGPGSFYDDVGHEGRSPRVEGDGEQEADSFRAPEPTFWWWDSGRSRCAISGSNRASA